MSSLVDSDILLEYAQDKIVVIDEEGVFRYVNRAAEPILGYDPETLIGENTFEYIHPEDRARVRDVFESVIGEGRFRDATGEYRFRRADGSWCWLESRFSNLTDSQLDGYVVSSRDVTDRVEAEQRQADTESRLKEIAHTTADVLWMFSGDWDELLFVNPAYEHLYGSSIEALKANPRNFLESIHPEDREAVEKAMEALSNGSPVDMEYRIGSGETCDRWMWVQSEPITEDGEVVRIVGFTRDITDRRRRERQLAVMDNLLRHNLRNELNVIISAVDTIERETDVDDITEQTRVIRKIGSELVETAEKQRDIIDVLTDPTECSTVDLVMATHSAVDRVRRHHPDATIDVDLPDMMSTCGLPELELAIAELIDNAAKHATHSPRVRVTGKKLDGDRLRITVEDNGPPIPEEEYRVLTGDREMNALYHSSGLGLWLVYWVVTLSDGSISFRERPRGNTITITLSATDSD
ncbi:PAS domain-containing sensor histidine kinase [Halovenus marina]|uniref:PAS domain-containing sensor histidine kinase n=1 Tax=Halovenus marina TaxID=3396621 RepID=UPI003F557FCB